MSRSLGSLRINLLALTGKFEANFNKATGTLDKFGAGARKVASAVAGGFGKMTSAFGSVMSAVLSVQSVLTGAAAVIAGSKFVGAFDDAAETVDNLGKKAKTLGLSIESLSALRLAAGESGVDFDSLAKMVGKATKGLAEFAAKGSGKAADAAKRLNVQLFDGEDQLRSMDDLLPEIAASIEKIGDQGEKLRLAEGLFGREGGTQFVQWLEDSGGFMANLAEQTDRARKLGVLFTEQQFDKLKAYKDALGRVSEAWLGLRVRVMAEVAPALTSFLDAAALKLAKVGTFLANFASVARAAIMREDIFQSKGEGDVNVALEAIKKFVGAAFDVAWSEVSTRIRYFFARVWETVKILLVDLLGKAGAWIGEAFDKLGGWLGAALKPIGSMLAGAFGAVADALSAAGSYYADAWDAAGKKLEAYEKTLADSRQTARDALGASIEGINRLGEKYRLLRGEVEATAKTIREKLGRSLTEWEQNFSDFYAGMKFAFKELSDDANDFAALGRNVFSTFANGISQDLAQAVASGETSFKNFGSTVLRVLGNVLQKTSEVLLQFVFMRGILAGAGAIMPGFTTEAATTPTDNFIGPRAAKGGVFGFRKGGVASGVLDRPALFGFNSKKNVGMAGEAGKEVAFAPLRSIGGELGVKAVGGNTTVQIIDQRSSGERPSVTTSREGGVEMIRVLIRDTVNEGIGSGAFEKNLAATYDLRRKGNRR